MDKLAQVRDAAWKKQSDERLAAAKSAPTGPAMPLGGNGPYGGGLGNGGGGFGGNGGMPRGGNGPYGGGGGNGPYGGGGGSFGGGGYVAPQPNAAAAMEAKKKQDEFLAAFRERTKMGDDYVAYAVDASTALDIAARHLAPGANTPADAKDRIAVALANALDQRLAPGPFDFFRGIDVQATPRGAGLYDVAMPGGGPGGLAVGRDGPSVLGNIGANVDARRNAAWKALADYQETEASAATSATIDAAGRRGFYASPPAFDPAAAMKKAFQTELSGSNDKKMVEFVKLLTAKQIGSDPQFAGYVDMADIDRRVGKLLQDPDMLKSFQAIQTREAGRIAATPEFKKYVEYIGSWEFNKSLDWATPSAAKEKLDEVIGKLALVDPSLARATAAKIADRMAARDLAALDDEALAQRLADIETQLGGNGAAIKDMFGPKTSGTLSKGEVKGIKAAVDVSKGSVKIADSFRKALLAVAKQAPNEQAAIAALGDSGFGKTKVGHALGWFSKADANGRLGSTAAVLGLGGTLVDVLNGKVGLHGGKVSKEDIDALRTALKTAAATESFGKYYVFIRGTEIAKTGDFAKAAKMLKFVGPAADGLGVYNEINAVMRSADENNGRNQALHIVGATGYGLASLGGTLVLIPTPWTEVTGAVLILVGSGMTIVVDIVVGKDFIRPDEGAGVVQLKKMELLKSVPKDVATYRSLTMNIEYNRTDLARAKHHYEEARYALDNPHRYDKQNLDKARNNFYAAKAEIGRLEKEIARKEAEIGKLQKSFADQRINPGVWDGHEEFLRNQDDARRAAAEKAKREDEREAYLYKQRVQQYRMYENSCTSDRRDCPGPIGEEARRVLGPRGAKKDAELPDLFDGFGGQGKFGSLTGPGGKLSADERSIIEKWMPRPGRRAVPAGDQGHLESAVRKLDRNSAIYQAFIKDPGSCGACHTTK
jgi:hypothetical protein